MDILNFVCTDPGKEIYLNGGRITEISDSVYGINRKKASAAEFSPAQ
jgi:hypothetical protein